MRISSGAGIGVQRYCEETLDVCGCSCCEDRDHIERICADATATNENGQTPLHAICQDQFCSVEAVQALIAACPQALRRKDMYGRLPIFHALKRGCPIDVVKILFDQFPEGVLSKDFCGDMALYLLYHPSVKGEILDYILNKMPSLSMHRENSFSGQPLFKRICAPWASREVTFTRAEIESNSVLHDRWIKLALTLRAAQIVTAGTQQDENGSRDFDGHMIIPELHMALKSSCPAHLVSHFVEMYPQQAAIKMETEDCYPLHFLLRHYKLNAGRANSSFSVVVRKLLSAFPDAIHESWKGKLPIHLASDVGLTWGAGFCDIVFAEPSHLYCEHPDTQLFPFLHSATSSEDSDFSTVYNLLRENPAVLRTTSLF